MQKLCLPRTGGKKTFLNIVCILNFYALLQIITVLHLLYLAQAKYFAWMLYSFSFCFSGPLLSCSHNQIVSCSWGNVSLSQVAFNSLITGFPFSIFVYAQHQRKNNSYQPCKTGEQCFLPSGTTSKRVISQLFMYLPHRALFQEPQYTVPSHAGV